MLSEKAVFVFEEEQDEYTEKQYEKLSEIGKKMNKRTKDTEWIWETYDVVKMMLWNW